MVGLRKRNRESDIKPADRPPESAVAVVGHIIVNIRVVPAEELVEFGNKVNAQITHFSTFS